MCGIVGFVGFTDVDLLHRMNREQRHRGPDDSGVYLDPATATGLAMQRLTIVDAPGGHQPMANADGSVRLVFNGEIFNAPELRRELERRGCAFLTHHSDTEVVLKLYEMDGVKGVARLNGMFAYVIYDRPRRMILGVRDPFGIKPLYYHIHSKGIAWASELKSLRVLPTFSNNLDPVAVDQYFGLQCIPRERSVYMDARKLLPGHLFRYDLATRALDIEPYYSLPFGSRRITSVNASDAGIRTQFQEAVARWTMSDVPVACSLSGGVDSGAVVAAMAHAGKTVKTYTLGFRSSADSNVDEIVAARSVAERYGTDHHEIIVDVDDLIGALPRMVWHLDEPYGGGLPSWFVFREIAREMKVAMTGTGGDELFSNYGKYMTIESQRYFQIAQWINRRLAPLGRGLGHLARFKSAVRLLGRLCAADKYGFRHRQAVSERHLFWKHPFGLSYPTAHGSGFNELISAVAPSELSAGREVLERIFLQFSAEQLRDRCVAVDFATQLPDEFLLMTDRFSMAHSLEARTPFLDKEFVAYVLGIDARDRLTPEDPKVVFSRAVKDWLPPGHTTLVKRGFVLPVARWLRGRLRKQAEELFSETALRRAGYVRPDFAHAFFRPFLEGHADLTNTVWTAFMFRLWQETASTPTGPST
jgi:asparagine synthase (glutamine-hydrolysing)